jgi:hypothetical protein
MASLGVDIRKYPQLGLRHPLASIRERVSTFIGTTSTNTGFIAIAIAMESDVEIVDIYVVSSATVAASGTNYWAIDFQAKGSAGTATTSLFSSAQDTQTTGFTANVPRQFTPDQNQRIAQGTELAVKFTKAASAPNLDDLAVVVLYRANA